MKFVNFIIVITAIIIALIATLFVSRDKAFAIFLTIMGLWLINSGHSEIKPNLAGTFSLSTVKVGWGGFLISASVVWIIHRIIEIPWQLICLIFMIGLIITLILAQSVEKKARRVLPKL